MVKKKSGSIVYISSSAAIDGNPGRSAYASSKAAINSQAKVLSNEFKDLITEPNLFINPKNKPQIEIPNLCNFWVHSNSDTPLYIEGDDRRAFVVNIKHSKQSVNFMLNDEGYKKDILKAHCKERAIADFIAGMTDRYALNLYKKIK